MWHFGYPLPPWMYYVLFEWPLVKLRTPAPEIDKCKRMWKGGSLHFFCAGQPALEFFSKKKSSSISDKKKKRKESKKVVFLRKKQQLTFLLIHPPIVQRKKWVQAHRHFRGQSQMSQIRWRQLSIWDSCTLAWGLEEIKSLYVRGKTELGGVHKWRHGLTRRRGSMILWTKC